MAKGRLTVRVDDVRAAANSMLALSKPDAVSERKGIIALLENVLIATGNYRGYVFTADQYVPSAEQTPDNILITDHDNTRRVYR